MNSVAPQDGSPATSSPCRTCGAVSGLFMCTFCGTPIRTHMNEDEERAALDELHAELSRLGSSTDDEKRHRLLTNAFLPSSPSVLIEAGLRLIPILEQAVARADAAGRMRAIIVKLRLAATHGPCRDACTAYEEALERYERYDADVGRTMALFIGGALLVTLAAIIYALRRTFG